MTQSRSTVPSRGSRAQFERRVSQLPDETRARLAKGELQAADAAFYVVKSVAGSRSQKMLRDDDNKVVGISNLSSGKLEKGSYFLLDGITLLAGTAGEGETAHDVNFNVLPDFIRNGQFELSANNTTIIDGASLELFNTSGQDVAVGHYTLDNPKMIDEQKAIELNLEWGADAPAGTFIKAILRGSVVTKA
ncbi:MAG TPA: hypothetical protein DCR04_05690 [Flavobacteriales bacterium]|jgi:hypothetical protein|nr:hypothetical protein [Flavobacteriales bacterium]